MCQVSVDKIVRAMIGFTNRWVLYALKEIYYLVDHPAVPKSRLFQQGSLQNELIKSLQRWDKVFASAQSMDTIQGTIWL